jgi:hypothetical protein
MRISEERDEGAQTISLKGRRARRKKRGDGQGNRAPQIMDTRR